MTYKEGLRVKARGVAGECYGNPLSAIEKNVYAAILSATAPLLALLAKKDEALKSCLGQFVANGLEWSIDPISDLGKEIKEALSLQPTAEQRGKK